MVYGEDYGDQPQCKTCKHWLGIDDETEPTKGQCNGLPGDGIEINLDTAGGGGWISTIITDHDFYCALYE